MLNAASLKHFGYPFSADERASLELYRAAVQAGLYTDEISCAPMCFTLSQLKRLAIYKAAVQASFFTDANVPGRKWLGTRSTNGLV